MSQMYVVCEFGQETGRVAIGNLHKGSLEISEIRRFPNVPVMDGQSLHWNIPELYDEVIGGLRSVGDFEEPVAGLSCVSWPGAYLLCDSEGALMMPTYHHQDPRAEQGIQKVRSSSEINSLFQEAGCHPFEASLLYQLAAEHPKRLKQAAHALSIADGFNFLLSGVARTELSMASASQFYNPVTGLWSEQLMRMAGIPARLLPEVVAPGTTLGPLRPEIASSVGLQETNVLAGLSEQMASAVMGLPVDDDESVAFLYPGKTTIMGCQVTEPLMTEQADELGFNNLLSYPGSVCLHKMASGLSILDACMSFWDERNRGMDSELLSHLAGSAPPFECLIDPSDPRFLTANDMPLKIQAYCKETGQPVPRKPGPIYRCILESLALMYRRVLHEMQFVTGAEYRRVYLLGGKSYSLLNHFIANALRIPVVVASPDSAAIGNVVVQGLAVGAIKSLEEARAIVRQCTRTNEVAPHASVWEMAYERFVSLAPVAAVEES